MELVQEILIDRGYVTHGVVDGEQALKYIEAGESYDLILMDIELPGMNGFEIIKLIKAKYKDLPIIALTSYGMKGDKERILAVGFDEYISKPLDIEDFIKRIEKYKKH
jgi:CheY-like chemotaxis protein